MDTMDTVGEISFNCLSFVAQLSKLAYTLLTKIESWATF